MSDCIKTRKGIQNYVGRVKESGRIERRHSSFYVGLYGHTWVNFKDFCIELVTELMRLNPNKRDLRCLPKTAQITLLKKI